MWWRERETNERNFLNDIMYERRKNWLERVKEHCTQLNCLFGWLQESLFTIYIYITMNWFCMALFSSMH